MNATNTSQIDPVLKITQVEEIVSYSKSQIYRLIAAGHFPDRVRLGEARVGWRRSDIVAWLASRPAGSSKSAKIPKGSAQPGT